MRKAANGRKCITRWPLATRIVFALTMVATLDCVQRTAWAAGRNIALGRPYTMTKPTYKLCTDPGDNTQLTDGVRTKGYFWTQKTTVGWTKGSLKYITIDLGGVRPISGMAVSSAGGVAGVRWPTALMVFVSDDGKQWYLVGDLVRLQSADSPTPPYGRYATHVFQTDRLNTYGRFVQLVVEPGGDYFFADEIEIYEGDPSLLQKPRPGPPVSDLKQRMKAHSFNRLIKQQLARDLQSAREDILASNLPKERQSALLKEATALAQRIETMPEEDPRGFRAVLPMNDLERDIFRFQSKVWRARGVPPLRVWKKHRWDPLRPSEDPPANAPSPTLRVAMMVNEYRADVFNITNAGPKDKEIRIRIEGLPGGPNPEWVRVHEVLHVGTRRFVAVAAALPLARMPTSSPAVRHMSRSSIAWMPCARLETFTSFGVSTKVTYASDMTRRYQTNGVPTIIVAVQLGTFTLVIDGKCSIVR